MDVSQSMAGFAGGDSASLSIIHVQVLEQALSELGANQPFERCALDEALRCENNPLTTSRLNARGTYRGHDAALDLALRRPRSTSDPLQRRADPLDPFAVSVLVTDGFQTAHQGGTATDAGVDVACAGGADPACIGSLLAARVREGYGVWVGRVYLPFHGKYYPERPVSDTMWTQIGEHVAQLAAPNSGWNNVHFAASHRARRAPSGVFEWDGARSLLMFILSRDHALGRNLVERIRSKLTAERTLFPRSAALDIQFSELAPFAGLSAQLVPALVRQGTGPTVDAVVVDQATRTPAGVDASAHCSLQGAADLRMEGVTGLGVVAPPPYARVVASWRLSGLVAEGLSLLQPRSAVTIWPAGGGSPFPVSFHVDCTQLAPGVVEHHFGVYVEWSIDAQARDAQWFMRESVDTSYEAPEQVFHLRQMVTPPIDLALDRRGWLDQLTVHLERR